MSDFNTKLMTALFKGEPVDEILRQELESAMNDLLRSELTVFLDYEKHDPIGYNSGNSRNGSYERQLKTRFGEITVEIPRDRNGEFKQQLIPIYHRSTGDLEAMVIQMYRKGITTSEIADLIEKMYGAHYTPQTISNMTRMVQEQVERYHNRPLNSKYVVIYCDATYLAVRRDSVAKEALHILLGITPDGSKEVLDYRLYPTESSENYRELFQDLRRRGVKEVLLFVSDGLNGLREVCVTAFP
jgi:putative transposase